MSTLHQRLRNACQPAHNALESTRLLSRLTSPTLTSAEFASLLQRFYRCHLGLHHFLHPLLHGHAFAAYIDPACRLEALRNDLSLLGAPVPTVPVAVNLPATREAAIGVLYVLLGAHLGSLMIAKQLATHRDASIRQANHFYGKQAHQGLQDWQTYLQSLDTHVVTVPAQTQVISAAIATFALIETALTHSEAPT